MTEDIPQWALTRAWEEVQARVPSEAFNREAPKAWMETFARYIAAHEEPPVDPLVAALKHTIDMRCDKLLADNLRADLAKRGLEIREVQP